VKPASFEHEAETRRRYSLGYQYTETRVIHADSVDAAVEFAKSEAIRTQLTITLWDYAVRHVATLKPDGTLGYNGAVTRYPE
jgi:catechol 2,3-dioxygenase-like lactoylglutathione lyase family enzyme